MNAYQESLEKINAFLKFLERRPASGDDSNTLAADAWCERLDHWARNNIEKLEDLAGELENAGYKI